MAIIGAAALIAVGIVVAALVYGRTHRGARVVGRPTATDVGLLGGELRERSAELGRLHQHVGGTGGGADVEHRNIAIH